MRLWNGLTLHSIVLYEGKMYKILGLYEKNGVRYADLKNGENKELKEIEIEKLQRVDD